MYKILVEKDDQTSSLGLAKYLSHIREHFFAPNPYLFYTDFTLSALAGDFCLFRAIETPGWIASRLLWIFISALCMFRATVFLHEAYHLGKHLRGFVWWYNLLHGFTHKLPFYCYTPHRYHHLPETYGTINDPEYEALSTKPLWYSLFVAPCGVMAILPVFMLVRWGIMPAILPFIGTKARDAIYARASTLAMNPSYVRPVPSVSERRAWYGEDMGCLIYSVAWGWLIYVKLLPWQSVGIWYAVFYLVAVLNYYRVLISHRYFTELNATTHKQQVLDSGTLLWSPLNSWLYPVGLRYHALHHMFPQIPYHHMGEAHKWLMLTLPPDHPYRLTVSKGYFIALKGLLIKKF